MASAFVRIKDDGQPIEQIIADYNEILRKLEILDDKMRGILELVIEESETQQKAGNMEETMILAGFGVTLEAVLFTMDSIKTEVTEDEQVSET